MFWFCELNSEHYIRKRFTNRSIYKIPVNSRIKQNDDTNSILGTSTYFTDAGEIR